MLTATVLGRRQTSFQLVWPAPNNNGAPVTGYQVRYAKVPITTTNFDDTTVTTAVPYAGTPAAPGTADGMVVSNLYIENSYYFAVTGTGPGGASDHVGMFMPTPNGVAAHFNVTILNAPTGPSTNALFGVELDGSADVNGDGLSDLLVATSANGHAYLYLGGANFGPATQTVTFASTTSTTFGNYVRAIGDIDADGLQDVAIGDTAGLQVRIYKGRKTWPAMLMDTQADYTITTDATWANSLFGYSLAPVGDFNNDQVDDFVVSAPSFNTRTGRVAVIYGRSGFTSFTLSDNTRALEIGGDPALTRTQFGLAVVGLGHFLAPAGDTTLIVSAPGLGNASNASSNEGRIYAFHGRGPGAALDASMADGVRVGPGKGALIGQTLSNLGPLLNTLPALGVGNSGDTLSVPGTSGSTYVLSGTAATGPLANTLILYQSGGSAVGEVIFGGGFSGRDGMVSVIGGPGADVAIASQMMSAVDIIDGSKVGALTSPADTKALADVHVPLPGGWAGTAPGAGNLIRDIDGDGVADFALGDVFGSVPGRVAVFW
jgi:hypothetical protein